MAELIDHGLHLVLHGGHELGSARLGPLWNLAHFALGDAQLSVDQGNHFLGIFATDDGKEFHLNFVYGRSSLYLCNHVLITSQPGCSWAGR